jgi:archaellum component FlaF (FlaF/FlaG flagellin family)
MLFRRSKSGISTVLGTLIFIGILFTCAIPFYLRINQANTYYTQAVDEMRRSDEKRGMENIEVYAYPFSETSDELKVYIKNRCALSVTIVTVWVNDKHHEILATIPSSGDQTYGPFTVTLPTVIGETKNFYIEVLTNRGNRFASLTNPLTYTKTTETKGFWSGGVGLAINIAFKSGFGKYDIVIDRGGAPVYQGSEVIARVSDVLKRVDLTTQGIGTYYVTVTKGGLTLVNKERVDLNYDLLPSGWVYVL